MKLKKNLVIATICSLFTILNFSVVSFAAPSSISITSLQNQIKSLQAQLKQKDATITALQSQLTVQPLSVNFSFDGVEKSGQYSDGISTVPAAFTYKGIIYSPINYIGDNIGKTIQYVAKDKTIYVGKTENVQYMSDILKPYYQVVGELKVNRDIKLAGKEYSKGFHVYPWNFQDSNITFNLEGKYTNINGLIGLCDYRNGTDMTVEIYGDNNLLAKYVLPKSGLPQDLNLDVTGVVKLTFLFTDPKAFNSAVDLANLVIE